MYRHETNLTPRGLRIEVAAEEGTSDTYRVGDQIGEKDADSWTVTRIQKILSQGDPRPLAYVYDENDRLRVEFPIGWIKYFGPRRRDEEVTG